MRRSNQPSPVRSARLPVALGLTLGLLVFALIGALPARAQRAPGTLNVGLQVGRPSGVTAKLYRASPAAYAGSLTTDADDVVTLHVYRLQERPLPDSQLHLYVGPGVVAGGRTLDDDAALKAGLSLQAGLNFYAERFEVFLQTAPTLHLLPDVRPLLGGSVGLRYSFGRP